MKIIKLFLLSLALVFIGQVHAGAWDELKPYVVTDETPIIFSPKDNTLVLDDPQGTLTVEEVLKRKDEFKPPSEMAPLDTRHHYWIMQKISSGLKADRSQHFNISGWVSLYTHVIASDGSVTALSLSGTVSGYSFLSDIDPALPGSAKVPTRLPEFMLYRGEALTLLTHARPLQVAPPKFVLRIVNNERFLETRRFGVYVTGGMVGILFALAIFAWYSYYRNKDQAGLLYGVWIIFAFLNALGMATQDGFHLFEFFYNGNSILLGETSLSVAIFQLLSVGQIITYFIFSSAFLQIGRYYPKTQKLVYFLAIYFVIHTASTILIKFNIPAQTLFLGNAIFPLLVFGFLYKAAFERYLQGMSVALFWLVASIPYLIFRLIFVAGIMGYPSPFSYLPESGLSYLLQNSVLSQGIGYCLEAIIMSLAVVARNNWIQEELNKSLAVQKTLAEDQKALVENQNKVLEETVAERTKKLETQHQELDEVHQLVVGSVNYASRLQRGQLPRQMRIDGRFASFASIWEPRDTIGGDLYWLSSSQQSGPFVLAVADCTGHGVPGAMLSLLVSNSLERIYANATAEDQATALMSLDHFVRTGLNQDRADSESDDGCDAAVLRIDREKQTIEFAGAKLGLFQVNAQGVLTRHQAARCSLGYQDVVAEADKPVVQKIPYQSGDVFAVVTDGFTDQIGGSTGKTSFGYRRLEEILKTNCAASAEEIAAAMKREFAAWQGTNARRDDVTAVVFRL
jgi:serine phosphatase RsbU (regulator of sigma subunit)